MHGVYNIMATPFTAQGEIDEGSLRRLVDFIIGCGVHGLTILGILGEFHKLSEAERDRVTRIVLEQAVGRVPVIVGVTHTGTDVAVALARSAVQAGAAGVMAAPPTNLKNLDAVAVYYCRIAAAIDAPLVLQDEPVSSGVVQPAAFLARVAAEIDTARSIKLEEAPTPPKISQLLQIAACPLQIFGGLGGVYFLNELDRGAAGTMTGFAFPEVLLAVYRLHQAGDREGARDLFYKYLPLISYEGQAGIGLALRKEILRRRGAIAGATLRHPAMGIDPPTQAELDALFTRFDLGAAPLAI